MFRPRLLWLILAAILVPASFPRVALAQEWHPGKSLLEWAKDLDNPESRTRRNAAIILGRAGEDAVFAVPALLRCLKDPDATVREEVALALAGIGPTDSPDAIPMLKVALAKDSAPEGARQRRHGTGQLREIRRACRIEPTEGAE